MTQLNIEKLIREDNTIDIYVLQNIIDTINKTFFNKTSKNILTFFKGMVYNDLEVKNGENKIRISLGFKPDDVFITKKIPSDANVYIKYEKNTKDYIYIQSDQECKIRLIIGHIDV